MCGNEVVLDRSWQENHDLDGLVLQYTLFWADHSLSDVVFRVTLCLGLFGEATVSAWQFVGGCEFLRISCPEKTVTVSAHTIIYLPSA